LRGAGRKSLIPTIQAKRSEVLGIANVEAVTAPEDDLPPARGPSTGTIARCAS
jgi:hypothetical protein